MRILIGDGREVYWVNAPVMRDEDLEENILEVDEIQREVAARFPDNVTFVDAHTLFADEPGEYQSSLPDETGDDGHDARRRRHPPHRRRRRAPRRDDLHAARPALADQRPGGAGPDQADDRRPRAPTQVVGGAAARARAPARAARTGRVGNGSSSGNGSTRHHDDDGHHRDDAADGDHRPRRRPRVPTTTTTTPPTPPSTAAASSGPEIRRLRR